MVFSPVQPHQNRLSANYAKYTNFLCAISSLIGTKALAGSCDTNTLHDLDTIRMVS